MITTLSLVRLSAFALAIAAVTGPGHTADALTDRTATVTLDNHSGQALELWVDRTLGCEAANLATCTVTVVPGDHELQARHGETVVAREFVRLKDGEGFSYHVEPGVSPNQ